MSDDVGLVPIDLMPREEWLRRRYRAILDALASYDSFNKPAPWEWHEELFEIASVIGKIEGRKR